MSEAVTQDRTDFGAFQDALHSLGCKVHGRSVTCPWHEDKSPSASILEGDEGAWRVWCHVCGRGGDVWDLRATLGGVPVESLLREAGKGSPAATRSDSRKPAPAKPEEKPPTRYASYEEMSRAYSNATAYPYMIPGVDEPRMIVYRYEKHGGGKGFAQVHHDGKSWLNRAPEAPRPIYRIPDIRDKPAVVVVEGEKCAEIFWSMGIPTTTSPCGGGNASKADWSPLKGKRICIWPDHDEKGAKYAEDVSALLRDAGVADIRIVALDRLALPVKGDIEQFLEALGDITAALKKAAVLEVLKAAPSTGASRAVAESMEDIIGGRLRTVALPWPMLNDMTKMLMPGAVSVVAGTPGAAKSFFTLSAIIGVHRLGESFAMMQLEETPAYWLQRLLAILEGNGSLTDLDWIQANAESARAANRRQSATIDALGSRLWVNQMATYKQVGDWIEARCQAGVRVLLVDPISVADPGKEKMWDADRNMMLRAKQAAGEHGASIIFVSHPKAGPLNRIPSLDSIAGGQAIPRLASTVLWIEPRDEQEVDVVTMSHGTVPCMVNRCMRVLKARNSRGTGLSISYRFDGSRLEWVECGIVSDKDKPDKEPPPKRPARMSTKPNDKESLF